jgi:hypothetical protein
LRFFEIEFETDRYTEAVTGPALERQVHHAQDEVQALQRPVFLAGGTRAIAVAGQPFDVAAGFFLRRIVEADLQDCAFRDKLGCQADDCPPEVPALLVERAPEEHIEAGKVLEGGCPSEPQIGRDGVAVRGQGPATGQHREGVPRWGTKNALKQSHDHGSKGRVYKGVHGNVLQQASLSW